MSHSIVRCQECFLYTYTGVGLSALLFSTFMELKFGKQYDLAARGVF